MLCLVHLFSTVFLPYQYSHLRYFFPPYRKGLRKKSYCKNRHLSWRHVHWYCKMDRNKTKGMLGMSSFTGQLTHSAKMVTFLLSVYRTILSQLQNSHPIEWQHEWRSGRGILQSSLPSKLGLLPNLFKPLKHAHSVTLLLLLLLYCDMIELFNTQICPYPGREGLLGEKRYGSTYS